VEVVAGVQPDPGGQPPPEGHLGGRVEQGHLDAADPAVRAFDELDDRVRGRGEVGGPQ